MATLLLAGLLLSTLLLLAGLLLSTLLATLVLTALLLLAGLLVRILVHFVLSDYCSKRDQLIALHRNKQRLYHPICSGVIPPSPLSGTSTAAVLFPLRQEESTMGRYLLLWLLGVPIPILVLIWIFGGLH